MRGPVLSASRVPIPNYYAPNPRLNLRLGCAAALTSTTLPATRSWVSISTREGRIVLRVPFDSDRAAGLKIAPGTTSLAHMLMVRASTGACQSRIIRAVSAALLSHLIIGCAALERQAAVPSNLTEEATVLGIPNARFWPDTQGPALIQEANAALARERTVYDAAGANGPLPAANFLAGFRRIG